MQLSVVFFIRLFGALAVFYSVGEKLYSVPLLKDESIQKVKLCHYLPPSDDGKSEEVSRNISGASQPNFRSFSTLLNS